MREQEQFIEWKVNNKAYRIDKYSTLWELREKDLWNFVETNC